VRIWLLVGLLGFLCNLPFWLQAGGLDDEGVTSLGAVRILQGEVPYRDFDTRHSPGSYYTAALGLAALGPTVTGVRVLMLLNTALLGLALYAVARELLPERWALVPWALFCWGGLTQWPILSYHWMATLAWLAGVWAVLRGRWSLAGALVGLAGWYLQTEGVALGLGALALAGRQAPRVLGWAVASSLVLWLPVLVTAGPALIWHDSVAAMGTHVPFNRSPYSLRHLAEPAAAMLAQWSQGTLVWKANSLAYLGVWTCKYGLYFPVLAWGCWAGLRQGGKLRALVWLQVVLTVALANRMDMLYQNYLTPVWYVLLLCVARHRAVAVGLLLLFGVQYGFLCADAQTYAYPIQTPAGRLWSNSPGQAQGLNQLYGVAGQLTPPGTRTFAYPYAAAFYFLSQTRNATRYPVLVPLLYPREAAERATREREGVPVIYRFGLATEVVASDYPTVSAADFGAELKAFDALLLEGYELQGTAGPAEIWRLSAR